MEIGKTREDYQWEARGTCTSAATQKMKRRGQGRAPRKQRELLFLVFVLDRLNAAIVLCLRLGVFHGLLGFGGLLGASFGALFFLFVENLFATQQFEESFVGAIALIPVGADDARIPALAIAETRTHSVKQLHNSLVGHE